MNSDSNPVMNTESSIPSPLPPVGISIQKLVLAEVNSLITALRTNSRFTSKQRFACITLFFLSFFLSLDTAI